VLSRDDVLRFVCAIESKDHYLAQSHPLYDQCLREMSDCLVQIEEATGKKITKQFLRKLQLKGLNFHKEQFIQDSCEITLAGHFARKFSGDFIYEKRLGGQKNVDFSFSHNGHGINVEVKCPSPAEPSQDTVAVYFTDRMEDRGNFVEGISKAIENGGKSASEEKREDLKLRDFLISASEKFEKFNLGDVNVLTICCDDEMHMQKYRNYLLRTNPILDSLPFEFGQFPSVHYIQLINLGHRHRAIYSSQFHSQESPWLAHRALSLLYASSAGKVFPATGEIAAAFMSHAEDFEQSLSSNVLVPSGESADFLPTLGLAWYSDKVRPQGTYYFAKRQDKDTTG